ncbi:MAG: hypothetical protein SGARI_002904, partial [Bacillariaceae sp.]
MASTVDTVSSPSGDAKPAASSSSPAAPSKAVSPETKSPWDQVMAKIHHVLEAKNSKKEEYSMWILSDIEQVLSKLGYIDEEEDPEELSREERKVIMDKLTEEQIQEHILIAILPDNVANLRDEVGRAIMTSDTREGFGLDEGWAMFNTHSSFCMVQVIEKKLTAAVKEVNKAVKLCSVDPTKEIPGVAINAAKIAIGTIMGATQCDHYRCDTEDPESVNKILQRIGKILKDVFWFTDAELGWENDSMTRKALLKNFDEMAKEWLEDADGYGYAEILKPMKFKCPKNQQGMGRSLAAREPPTLDNPRPAKQPKVASLAQSTLWGSTGKRSLTSYFSEISDKLSLRVKTVVQLKIVSLEKPNKVEYAVVSGATDMKKLNHLVAYVTGCTADYHYHSQKGKSLPESRFELSVAGYKDCWITTQKESKKAASARADAVVDKSIKVVQVFQGLHCNPNEEM